MKSSIKVARNEHDQPCIRITYYPESDDLRDDTLKRFLQKLNGSTTCEIMYVMNNDFPEKHSLIDISPVAEKDIKGFMETLNDRHLHNYPAYSAESYQERVIKPLNEYAAGQPNLSIDAAGHLDHFYKSLLEKELIKTVKLL